MNGVVRQPRGAVRINGQIVPGVESWSVDNNTNYHADTFRVRAVLAESPSVFRERLFYWSALQDAEIEIFGGFPSDPENFTESDLKNFMVGQIDEIDIEPATNRVEIYGRDLSARLIDTKTTEKFINKKSSEIAEILAARHQLQTRVTPTATTAGVYYQIDHANLNEDRSEWDLLTYLAKQEGYQVYVDGRTLVFEPAQSGVDAYPLSVQIDDNGVVSIDGTRLEFVRNLTLARDVKVIVYCLDLKTHKRIEATATRARVRNALNPPLANAPVQTFSYRVAPMSKQKLNETAHSLAVAISTHQVTLNGTFPGDTKLTQRSQILVQNTGTYLDAAYNPVSVTRSLSSDEGFVMRVQAKNHVVQQDVIV